jgi:membrane associated rhomboid family serine protease
MLRGSPMFPLRDTLRTRIRPWLTILLVLLNAAVFAFELSLAPEQLERLVATLGLTPARFADPRWRARFGLTPADFWPFLSSLFLHAGLLHAASNLWFLWIFGDNIEERLGSLRFLAFYLACGVLAGAVHVIAEPTSQVPAIGASGAVAGVMGAYLRLFPRGKVLTLVPVFIFPLFVELPAVVFLGLWLLSQAVGASLSDSGLHGGVAFFAHLGGFAAGWLTVHGFEPRRRVSA